MLYTNEEICLSFPSFFIFDMKIFRPKRSSTKQFLSGALWIDYKTSDTKQRQLQSIQGIE